MWYELIPGLAIMGGVTFAAFNIYKVEQYFIAKGKSPRICLYTQDFYNIKRDQELTGCKWRTKGLESLPALD